MNYPIHKALLLAFGFAMISSSGAMAREIPDFQEVYSLIRSNAAGVTAAELNRAALQGLLNELGNKAVLVSSGGADVSTAGSLTRTEVYDQSFGYFRVGTVGADLASQFDSAYGQLAKTNQLTGLVLDLRFAKGQDYEAAAALADRFIKTSQPLLQLENKVVKSREKQDAITQPVMVLVNRQTAGAAEALAAALRDANVALVIGATTAGQAYIYKNFPVAGGQTLLVATARVRLSKGQPIPEKGVRPDIEVTVNADAEKAYFEDAYHVLPQTATLIPDEGGANRAPRRMINEAELVRRHREGLSPEEESAPGSRAGDPARKIVRDPALGRALDLLKGLAVVRQSRPQ